VQDVTLVARKENCDLLWLHDCDINIHAVIYL